MAPAEYSAEAMRLFSHLQDESCVASTSAGGPASLGPIIPECSGTCCLRFQVVRCSVVKCAGQYVA